MAFRYVYKALAHPEKDGLVQPLTIEERLAHIRRARLQLGSSIPWWADSMNNDLKTVFTSRNNSEFIIDPNGKVVVARQWSDPDLLRSDLERLVGIPEKVTRITDLDLDTQAETRPEKVARNVVPRIQRIPGAKPLRIEMLESEHPSYIKIRPEMDPRFLRSGGEGEIYLGFFMDPIHEVHWNNLAPPMKFEVILPEGVESEERQITAQKVTSSDADSDPREFRIALNSEAPLPPNKLLRLDVSYFACDDHDRFCLSVSQSFHIYFSEDPNAGSVQSRNAGRGKGGRKGRGSRPTLSMLLSRFDTDENGAITRAEAGGPLLRRFDSWDNDGDSILTSEELSAGLGQFPKNQ